MHYMEQIQSFQPSCTQEEEDKTAILEFASLAGQKILLRSSRTAHITSSACVFNPSLSRILLVRHTLRECWSWPGGHADGNNDLLEAALKEVREETGAGQISPLSDQIASLDIFPVAAHQKNGTYVGAHLHLSAGYCVTCGESQPLRACHGENSAVAWFPLDYFTAEHFSRADLALYQKLIARAKSFI